MKRKLKQPVIYLLYGIGFVALICISFIIEGLVSKKTLDEDVNYVSDTMIDKTIPVVSTDYKIIRPYNDSEVKVLLSYYDYKGEEESQENAIIVYNNTYMQSSGVTYGGKDNFDVISILDGKVITIKEDELLGNIVEISHDNGIISIYQGLSDVNVKVDDTVKQGQIIGKSGINKLNSDLGSSISFELVVNGSIVNPEEYYDKKLDEI